jgi:hypothetical protein
MAERRERANVTSVKNIKVGATFSPQSPTEGMH